MRTFDEIAAELNILMPRCMRAFERYNKLSEQQKELFRELHAVCKHEKVNRIYLGDESFEVFGSGRECPHEILSCKYCRREEIVPVGEWFTDRSL